MAQRSRIMWITKSAVFIALLVILQLITKSLGQFATGSVVNLVLILSVMLSGLWSGIAVAVLSPLFAFLVGIGPAFPPLLPFVALGNAAIVLVWHLIAGKAGAGRLVPMCLVATAAGAVAKFAVLYVGIVQIAIPLILKLPAEKAAALSASFSLPQLITAVIGGAIATIILPVLRKALTTPA